MNSNKKIGIYGNDALYFIVGIHKEKDEFTFMFKMMI